jgi:acetolactate synthase I/II/III large subunit
MLVADFIADYLHLQGVRTIFMLSGTGSIYLDDAFSSQAGMKHICARHEAAAVMMAEASAKLTGTIGVAVTTTGPGGANAFAGVVEAWADSVPVLVLSGQVARNQILEGTRSFGVQGLNIIDNVKNITKYAVRIDEPNSIRYHLEQAIHLALSGRQGPVWLDIPMDVQAAEIEPDFLQPFPLPPTVESSDDCLESVSSVINMLHKAERPMIVLGQGIRTGGLISEFKKLGELINIPIIASRMALDILPYQQANYFGLGGIRGRRATEGIMKECDFVLSLGSSMSHAFTGGKYEAFAKDVKIAMVNLDESELKKPGLKLAVPIAEDLRKIVPLLLEKLENIDLPDWGNWLQQCQEKKQQLETVLPENTKNPINSYYFIERLEAYSTEKNIFINDAGSSNYICSQGLELNKGQRELTSGAFYTMGITIPFAIGASVTDKDAQILAITGDGSIEMNIQELKTLSCNDVNIKLFVINNGGYASIRESQDAMCGGRYTDEQEILDFSKVAKAFDLPFHILDKAEELDEKIPVILEEKGSALIEVVCDENQEMIKLLKTE